MSDKKSSDNKLLNKEGQFLQIF